MPKKKKAEICPACGNKTWTWSIGLKDYVCTNPLCQNHKPMPSIRSIRKSKD